MHPTRLEMKADPPLMRWCVVGTSSVVRDSFCAAAIKTTSKYVGLIEPQPFAVGAQLPSPLTRLEVWTERGTHPAHQPTPSVLKEGGSKLEESKVAASQAGGHKASRQQAPHKKKYRGKRAVSIPTFHTVVVTLGGTTLPGRVNKAHVHVLNLDETVLKASADHGWRDFIRAQAKQRKLRWVHWVGVAGGRVTLWHRPPPREIAALPDDGCTVVVTLQAEREKAKDVGAAVKRQGMRWLWCPLEGANKTLLATKTVHRMLHRAVSEAAAMVREGESLCIHCAAGMHRTGVFGYMLGRRLGLTPDGALALLLNARPITRRNVGAWRIELAEELHCRHVSSAQSTAPDADAVASDGCGADGCVGSASTPTSGSDGATRRDEECIGHA